MRGRQSVNLPSLLSLLPHLASLGLLSAQPLGRAVTLIVSTYGALGHRNASLLYLLHAIMLAHHPAPDRAASRSSILSVAFFGTMMHLRGASLTQRRLFWPEEFLFSSEALNFRAPLS